LHGALVFANQLECTRKCFTDCPKLVHGMLPVRAYINRHHPCFMSTADHKWANEIGGGVSNSVQKWSGLRSRVEQLKLLRWHRCTSTLCTARSLLLFRNLVVADAQQHSYQLPAAASLSTRVRGPHPRQPKVAGFWTIFTTYQPVPAVEARNEDPVAMRFTCHR